MRVSSQYSYVLANELKERHVLLQDEERVVQVEYIFLQKHDYIGFIILSRGDLGSWPSARPRIVTHQIFVVLN